MDERELLKAYAETGDQGAFAQLVKGHGDWVYAAARRQLGDEHLAEDVTQAVFLLLVRKARRLRGYGYLGGWLIRAAQYCVREAKRQRMRQERREKEAAEMRRERRSGAGEASWEEIAGVLDEAVAGLRPADREMVLMRFYQGMSFAEVGAASGIGEEVAKKRVQRAVERLRGKLEKKGVTGTTAGLSVVLAENVVEQMPEHLMEEVVKAICGGGASATAGAIAKGAYTMLMWTKARLVAAVCLLVVMSAFSVFHYSAVAGCGRSAGAGGAKASSGPADNVAISIARNAFVVVSSDRKRAWALNPVDGTWVAAPAIPEGSAFPASVMVQGNVAAFRVDRRLYAFSGLTGRWDVVDIPVDHVFDPVSQPIPDVSTAVFRTDTRLYGFSAARGVWDSIEATPSPQFEWSSEVVYARSGTKVYVFGVKAGRWAVLDTSK